MAIEGFKKHGVGSAKFVGLIQTFPPPIKRLLAEHGASIAFHRGIMRRDQLGCYHALDLVLWRDSEEGGDSCAELLVARILVGVLCPKCPKRLVSRDVVPVVRKRAADSSSLPARSSGSLAKTIVSLLSVLVSFLAAIAVLLGSISLA
jgi:hypothetical protein